MVTHVVLGALYKTSVAVPKKMALSIEDAKKAVKRIVESLEVRKIRGI